MNTELAQYFLALMLGVGPHPGKSIYSNTPASGASSPTVAMITEVVDGKPIKAYRVLEPDVVPPTECAQPRNPACVRPRFDPDLQRWHRPETWAEGLERYWLISRAFADAAGDDKRLLKYAYVVMRHESGNGRRDVHEGTNHRPWRRKTIHEDGGRAWCLGQIYGTRSPMTRIPIMATRYEGRTLGEAVGVDYAPTRFCAQIVTDVLRTVIRGCGRRKQVTPQCVFMGYGGGFLRSSHPFIRARIATYNRLKDVPTELGKDVRLALNLPKSVKIATWRPLNTTGRRSGSMDEIFGSLSMHTKSTISAAASLVRKR